MTVKPIQPKYFREEIPPSPLQELAAVRLSVRINVRRVLRAFARAILPVDATHDAGSGLRLQTAPTTPRPRQQHPKTEPRLFPSIPPPSAPTSGPRMLVSSEPHSERLLGACSGGNEGRVLCRLQRSWTFDLAMIAGAPRAHCTGVQTISSPVKVLANGACTTLRRQALSSF